MTGAGDGEIWPNSEKKRNGVEAKPEQNAGADKFCTREQILSINPGRKEL
jgi:hypothetical protein